MLLYPRPTCIKSESSKNLKIALKNSPTRFFLAQSIPRAKWGGENFYSNSLIQEFKGTKRKKNCRMKVLKETYNISINLVPPLLSNVQRPLSRSCAKTQSRNK
jgi:hypothetical protein